MTTLAIRSSKVTTEYDPLLVEIGTPTGRDVRNFQFGTVADIFVSEAFGEMSINVNVGSMQAKIEVAKIRAAAFSKAVEIAELIEAQLLAGRSLQSIAGALSQPTYVQDLGLEIL